jgi:hypothetical protein
MNAPHVKKLFYKVILPEHTDYDKAASISGETDDFKWRLNKDQLQVKMKIYFASEYEARQIVDEYLKGWEIAIGLYHGPDSLKFTFEKAKFINLQLLNENGMIDSEASTEPVPPTLEAVSHISYEEFLPPPPKFRVSPEVEMMFLRYRMYRQGQESLLNMAYWCFTVLEYSAGGRSEAADQYRVDYRVFRKLGEICSNRGDANEISKLKGNATSTLLKASEREWVRAVVKRLILRAGEYAYDPMAKLQLLTMSDFPSLQ